MSKNMITLISSDNESFEIEESAAKLSRAINNIIEEDVTVTKGIPILFADSATLSKIIEYCNKHADEEDDLAEWHKQFLGTDFGDLISICRAAKYLDIKCLTDTVANTIADMIRGKSVEEFREIFNVENDHTPEEEAEIRKENAWAFQ